MSDAAHLNATNRHDFVLIFDVTNGNPNGDPDAGNLPRVDPETGLGIVTDVALKRKVRNYVDTLKGDEGRFKIYVQQGAILNNQHRRAYEAAGTDPKNAKQDDILKAKKWMCDNFFDIRTFGAVMSTEVNAGQVRGPVHLTFGRSVDPILGLDAAITRVALTKPDPKQASDDETARSGTMGRKAYIPYGLYVAHGFYVPAFAQDTGFSNEDLEILWQALVNMWDLDRSASRGLTACRGLYVFSHSSPLGNAPAHKLFDLIKLERKEDVAVARSFDDYNPIQVDSARLPQGVTFTQLVD
ncbi:type I-C CRISPR-associated protein Cas7/Csd2 [Deinococcus radiophilus]|uniref:Type I-C CRISPR-associated protein Cas7/Csd2 n=1 Tax=Deinococcus radiophilus TaxID=32062 RepID=A0A3S0JQF7_9DEIO|nr:type I-C CRISPR-associated protein Cas7/Csd2 [Deinococcus radiophilus]RTR26822.1 type I-C CRISPR-associated protein Cas7/Csd2 [Deinococcus radiophilus]UFA51814.1 type I-C CRISPR-associated protein Cas7/Csd2 [Deinococcus radiophilus]